MSGDPEWTPLVHNWPQGTPSYGSGVIGEAAYFDDQAYITIGHERSSCFWFPDLCPSGLTFSLWVKLSSYSGGTAFIFSNGGHTVVSYGISLQLKDDELIATVKTTTVRYRLKTDVTLLTTYTWIHMVIAWSTQEGIKVRLLSIIYIYICGGKHTEDPGVTYI